MKYDMCGAATVFGLMHSLHATGYQRRVNGIACLAENMPGSGAYRPGDVFKTYSGRRLRCSARMPKAGMFWLMDYGRRGVRPRIHRGLATLTGAVVVALGNQISGMWANDEEL